MKEQLVPVSDEERQVVAKARREYWTRRGTWIEFFLMTGLVVVFGALLGFKLNPTLGCIVGAVMFVVYPVLFAFVGGPVWYAQGKLKEFRVTVEGEREQQADELKRERKMVKWFLRKCKDLDARKLRAAVNVVGYAYDDNARPSADRVVIDPKHLLDAEVRLIADFIYEVYDLERATSNGRAAYWLREAGEQALDQRVEELARQLAMHAYDARTVADDALQSALKELQTLKA